MYEIACTAMCLLPEKSHPVMKNLLTAAGWARPFALVRDQPYDSENDVDERPENYHEPNAEPGADCLARSARAGVCVG